MANNFRTKIAIFYNWLCVNYSDYAIGLYSARGTVSKHLSISDIRFDYSCYFVNLMMSVDYCTGNWSSWITKRNSNTNTSPNPNPNNPTYPTDPVTLLNPTISRFTSAHQQARIPAGPHFTIYYRRIGLTLTLMVTLMVKECRLSAGWLPTLKPSQLTESASRLLGYYAHPLSSFNLLLLLCLKADSATHFTRVGMIYFQHLCQNMTEKCNIFNKKMTYL